MKKGRFPMVYAGVMTLFVVYLFSADYIFNILIKTGLESRIADIQLPEATADITFFIDEFRATKLNWKDSLYIRGWVFKAGVREAERDVYMVLKGKRRTLILDIEEDGMSRPDVTEYYRMDGEIHAHGFRLYVLTYRLKEDAYQIGFAIDDETGRHYHQSTRSLIKQDDAWSLSE